MKNIYLHLLTFASLTSIPPLALLSPQMDPAKQLVWNCSLLLCRKFQMLRRNWKRIWDWPVCVSEGASPFVFVLSFVVICTDYIGNCKSTYHATTTYWLICMPFTIILMFALLGCRPLPWVLAKTKTSCVFTSICRNRPPFFVWNLKSFSITPRNHLIKTCWNCTLIKRKKLVEKLNYYLCFSLKSKYDDD